MVDSIKAVRLGDMIVMAVEGADSVVVVGGVIGVAAEGVQHG